MRMCTYDSIYLIMIIVFGEKRTKKISQPPRSSDHLQFLCGLFASDLVGNQPLEIHRLLQRPHLELVLLHLPLQHRPGKHAPAAQE